MIVFKKRFKNIYPVRFVYFPAKPQRSITPKPWDVFWFRQASSAVKDAYAGCALATSSFHTLFSDLTVPLDEIKLKIEKSTLYEIRRAEGLPLAVSVNDICVSDLYEIISKFYGSKNMSPPARGHFEMLMSGSDIVVARLSGQIAVVHTLMKDLPGRVRLQYSFHDIDAEMSNQERGFANRYLHWWEFEHYKELGAEAYDWGGIITDPESAAYGISKFKKSFGGEEREEWHILVAGGCVRALWKAGLLSRVMPVELKAEAGL